MGSSLFSYLSLGCALVGMIAHLHNDWIGRDTKPVVTPVTGESIDTTNRPEENRFTKTVLSNDLNEPMELAVAPDGRVFFVERHGKFYMYDLV